MYKFNTDGTRKREDIGGEVLVSSSDIGGVGMWYSYRLSVFVDLKAGK